MSVYTRPRSTEKPNVSTSSPGLIFHKWQAWDSFVTFKRDEARRDYFNDVATAVQNIYQQNYPRWHAQYRRALQALGVETQAFPTVWRLLVGWGSNPTLEAGLALHHLYGFPYIPGSAVKGLLHHVAEMEAMEMFPASATPDKEKLRAALQQLRLIKILFGSIHLERARKKESGEEIGPACPQSKLKEFKDQLNGKPEWQEIVDEIDALQQEHTGGMLSFYDAVPEPDQAELLQTDIVNCHYGEYYGSEGDHPPSDDQQPVPATFLAVKPQAKFIFAYRLAAWPAAPGRDDEEKERRRVLHQLTRQTVLDQVNAWLHKALGEWGVGAKTAAGYGYFEIPAEVAPIIKEAPINASAPPPFPSTIKPAAKSSGIGQEYNQSLWQRLAASEYIAKIIGQKARVNAAGAPPARTISNAGKTLHLSYQNGRFLCNVELKLQGIHNEAEAQHLWEKVILPEVPK